MSGYYEQHGFFLGNVKKTPLKDFLSGGKYLEEVCTTLGTLKANNRKCDNCTYFERCNGGENDYAGKIATALPDYETNI